MLTSLTFDMRAPDFGPTPETHYAAALEFSRFADDNGIDIISLQEHHGSEDGYLPTPLTLGAAVAAVTKRIRLHVGALILPLHDPVEIAEQMAVVDLISNGRLEVTFGAGYVQSEFDMFQVSLADRAKRLDDGISIIIRALSGERFEHEGRKVFVRPRGSQKPHPKIFVGGGVAAAAKRAAKFGLGFYPLNPSLIPIYEEECAKLGNPVGEIVGSLPWVHISEDPDATWEKIAPHILHVARMYAKWVENVGRESIFANIQSLDQLKAANIYRVLRPEECIALAKEINKPGYALQLSPVFGGMPPELGWENLKLFVEKVKPHLPA